MDLSTKFMNENERKILDQILEFLYSADQAREIADRILVKLQDYRAKNGSSPSATSDQKFSAEDVILIAYGDIIQDPEKPDLQALGDFLNLRLDQEINTLHLVPLWPATGR
jgi:sucrose phosphorylase